MRDNQDSPPQGVALVDENTMARIAGTTRRQIGQLRRWDIFPSVRLGWRTVRYNPTRVLEALEAGRAAAHMAELVERQKARSAASKARGAQS